MNNDYLSSYRLRSNTKDNISLKDIPRINSDIDNFRKTNLTSNDGYSFNSNRNIFNTSYKDHTHINFNDGFNCGNWNSSNYNFPKTNNFELTPTMRYKTKQATHPFTSDKILRQASKI
jgi:hypothetical protein